MADKQFPLSIILRTVDRATAGISAVTKKLEAINKPVNDFRDAIGDLRKESGLDQVVEGFSGVGSAIAGVLAKLALIGGVVGLATHAVFGLVDEFDNMGDLADRLDVTVDFLAAMRYAAERSGASVEAFDQGITSLGQNMGQLRAGTGKMLKFLSTVSPELVTQLKATKGNEAAFRMLADAMKKITDPQKKLAFAQKTVGDSALAPMLSKGSAGLLELQANFINLAGSQEEAAAGAGAVDDSLKDLHASTQGIKAAILTGLAPALKVIVDRLAEWFSNHRGDIEIWAKQIGDELPGAVSKIVDWIGKAYTKVEGLVESLGGLKAVAVILAGIIAGPVVSSVLSLGVALLTTPVGWIIGGIAAIAVAIYEIYKHWDGIKEFFKGLWDGVVKIFEDAIAKVKGLIDDVVDALNPFSTTEGVFDMATKVANGGKITTVNQIASSFVGAAQNAGGTTPAQARDLGATVASFLNVAKEPTETKVKVEFANAPRGTRATADPRGTADVDLSVGYQMLGVF